MHAKTLFAAGALVCAATAIPMQQQQQKRDVIWETKTIEDVVTVAVTTTVWLNPGEETPAAKAHYGHGRHTKHTTTLAQTVTVRPVPAKQSPPSAPEAPEYTSPPKPAPEQPEPQPAPKPAPKPKPAPEQPAPQPAPEPAPKPPSTGGSNGMTGLAASGKSYTGDFTWYDTGLGACGITSSPSDHIVAIAESLFDSYGTANPNDNPLCGKTVLLTGADGSEYPAKIVDRCGGCAMEDLDLSQDFFNLVTNNGDGRVGGMKWTFA